jgi:hypothetical protein
MQSGKTVKDFASYTRRKGSVSVDVDCLQDYALDWGLRFDRDENYLDPIYCKAIPRFLDLFSKFGIKASFFIIGRDVLNEGYKKIIQQIIDEGHEIGNHTLNHYRYFSLLSREEKRKEIIGMQEAMLERFNYVVKGFRAPNYKVDRETFQILSEEKYLYDSSIHPTWYMLLLPIIICLKYRKLADFRREQAGVLQHLFAHKEIQRVYDNLFEVPISATPLIGMPFFGAYTIATRMKFFDLSLFLLDKFKLPLNYEFHAVELLGVEEDKLENWVYRHPAFSMNLSEKLKIQEEILRKFMNYYDLKPIRELLEEI